ncbi:MAG: FixH family protein [Acidimicrobiia bacterium]|nr:FixH family protein [Acidimicrobiia bacterium]
MKRTRAALGVGVAVLLAFLLTGIGAAAAHSERGVVEVVSSEPGVDGGVRYVVRLTYENDGDAVADATLTAVAVSPDGVEADPVVLSAGGGPGLYEGEVPLSDSGTWRVRFTSVTPAVTLEVTDEYSPSVAASTTTAPTTTDAPSTATDDEQDEITNDQVGNSVSSGGSGAGTLVFVGLLLALLVVGALAVRDMRRRRTADAPG